jgi:hypothetical protein
MCWHCRRINKEANTNASPESRIAKFWTGELGIYRERDWNLRLRRLAIALRFSFSSGVSKWRCFFRSGKISAFDTWRLNRRSADSIPSFSPNTT